jgi:CMP-N-acetylneuraminic acid synthetase
MYKGKRVLALIPARGGSKGLPGKNIRMLNGKPLIAWTIGQALRSRYVDKIVVSTDSRSIAAVSRAYGAEVPFMRPDRLADDSSRVADAMLYTIDRLEKQGHLFDYVALLEPTSPLRRDGDIDAGIKLLIDAGRGADSLVSVGKICLEHPAYAKAIARNGLLMPYTRIKAAAMRQALDPAYFPYGVIYLSKVSAVREYRSAYAGRILPLEVQRWQNFEINDVYDFVAIEAVMRHRQGGR